MGAPPAPAFATLYYGIFELELLNTFSSQLCYLKRYIDDQIGIWIHNPNPSIDSQLWQSFQQTQQSYCTLDWKFSELSKSVPFLDLHLLLDSNRVICKLYEKPNNLYLFIPPSSAHSPNVQQALVTGGIKRILTLTTHRRDQKAAICTFFQRLCLRGYNPCALRHLFRRGFESYSQTPKHRTCIADSNSHVFVHLPFHPRDPPRCHLQYIFRHTILQPRNEPHITHLQNFKGGYVGINRLIVAYHRHNNLRTLLFPRHVEAKCPGANSASAILSHLRETSA